MNAESSDVSDSELTGVGGSMPLVSVVVPTHDVAPWIEECLDSITGQTYRRLEIIVVDDRSTDGTPEIVAERALLDDRISLVRSDGEGGASARNTGIARATGTYLAFVDGDDLVPRDAYASLVSALDTSGSDVVVGTFLKFSSSRTWRPTAEWPAYRTPGLAGALAEMPSLIRGRACWNKLYRTDFWRANDITFPEVARSNDIVPVLTALTRAEHVDVIAEDVYLYRDRPGATSMTAKAGRYVGLASYLSQETVCLDIIIDTGEWRLLTEFASLFLDADGWVHLSRVLAAEPSAEPDAVDAVARPLTAILRRLPAFQFNRLPLERQMIFALAAVGDVEAAATVLASGDIRSIVPGLMDVGGLLRLVSAIDGFLTPEHTLKSAIYEMAVLAALRSVRDVDVDEVGALAAPLVGLRDLIESDGIIPGVFEGLDVVVDAFARHDAAAVQRFALLEAEGVVVSRAQRLRSGRLRLAGSIRPELAGADLFVGARHRATGRSETLGDLRLDVSTDMVGATWSVVLPRQLPLAGEWDLEVILRVASGGACTAPLDWSDGATSGRMLRTDRIGALSAPSASTRVSMIGYDELHRRAARFAIRRLDPSAQRRIHDLIVSRKDRRS